MPTSRSRRQLGIVIALVLLTAGGIVGIRRCGDRTAAPPPSTIATAASGSGSQRTPPDRGAATRSRAASSDPRTQPAASVAGMVTSSAGGPIAGAQVCASYADRELSNEEVRVPTCATTDASGAYRIAAVVPGTWSLEASAETYVPRAWRTRPEDAPLDLAPGEARTGVDFVLVGGAVRAHGVVSDINGGPVADAWVYVSSTSSNSAGNTAATATVRSAADGTFTAWITPGEVQVKAEADGYADGYADGAAPTERLEVLMSPESVLGGVVVLAGSDTPVPGARVAIEPDWRRGEDVSGSATTDDQGRFHITRLPPGRYKPVAIADGLYGEPMASTLLGLGQTVDDVRIEVHPMATVAGRVVVDDGSGTTRPCPARQCFVRLVPTREHDGREVGMTTDGEGQVRFRAVLPGTYRVTIFSQFFAVDATAPTLTVGAAPIADQQWVVRTGGRIVGTVRSKAGAPIAQARVTAQTTGTDPTVGMRFASTTSRADGSYELTGLAATTYRLGVDADGYPELDPGPQVTAAAGQATTADLVLDDGGTLVGEVVDPAGQGVRNANIWLRGARWGNRGARSTDDGSFQIAGVSAGDYRVGAYRDGGESLRKPGTTDDDVQGERVKVQAGQAARVRLVVEAQDGVITGTVTTAAGAPVPDAYLRASRESDAAGARDGAAAQETRSSWSSARPVLTDPDGAFRLTELAPGAYTLRAYRKGGGEAIAEHVRVGSTATLVMRPTGSIRGTVTMAGTLPATLTVALVDERTGVNRSERFYQTAGAFALNDLPAGTFVVRAAVAGAEGSATVTLAEGQAVDDLRIALTAKVRLRGRLIDLATGAPIAGLMVSAAPETAAPDDSTFIVDPGRARDQTSGADGRFMVADAPSGAVTLTCVSVDFDNSPYGFVRVPVQVPAGGEVDVGDVKLPARRIKGMEVGADLGFSLAATPAGTAPKDAVNLVSAVRAGGPAAAAGLKVGDVIVSTDGVDIQGVNRYLAGPLWAVPVGTKVVLGLASGASVTITAGPRP